MRHESWPAESLFGRCAGAAPATMGCSEEDSGSSKISRLPPEGQQSKNTVSRQSLNVTAAHRDEHGVQTIIQCHWCSRNHGQASLDHRARQLATLSLRAISARRILGVAII